jgi:hypothetical protein
VAALGTEVDNVHGTDPPCEFTPNVLHPDGTEYQNDLNVIAPIPSATPQVCDSTPT